MIGARRESLTEMLHCSSLSTVRLNQINRYWNKKAKNLGFDPAATMKDSNLRELEIQTILSCLRKKDVLVDIGGGNGWATLRYAQKCRYVYLFDRSLEMVKAARKRIRESGLLNIEANPCDLHDLPKQIPKEVTVINCTRLLINLGSHKNIQKGLRNLIQSGPRHGRLILTEGIDSHFTTLNQWRIACGLEPIPLNWHNTLLDKSKLERTLKKSFVRSKKIHYGVYYLLSRILHPLLVHPEPPQFGARINDFAALISRFTPAEVEKDLEKISLLTTYICSDRKIRKP